jgi:hypothetical protein
MGKKINHFPLFMVVSEPLQAYYKSLYTKNQTKTMIFEPIKRRRRKCSPQNNKK